MAKVMISGGFDIVHVGHIKLINEAHKLLGNLPCWEDGIMLIVLNTDEWLIRKKGYCVMPFAQREDLLKALWNDKYPRYPLQILPGKDEQGHIAENIIASRPSLFLNGGDRDEYNCSKEEVEACQKVGCIRLYGVVPQLASSSEFVECLKKRLSK